MTLHINGKAEEAKQRCIENAIFAIKKRSDRRKVFRDLFRRVVDFSQIPYVDDSITRIILRTRVEDRHRPSNTMHVPVALRHLTRPYMGLSLNNLECLIGEDETYVIRYTSAECYSQQQLHPPFVLSKDVVGIGEKDGKLHEGVYKVRVGEASFVYKEPTTPDDVKSQVSEIESLMLLSKSPYIILKLHGLVVSDNPYLTRRSQPCSSVVKGLLLQYGRQGSLCDSLMSDAEITWTDGLSLAIQIASGLRDMHDANILHIDLESHNVVIDGGKAFIIDLGRTRLTYGWNAPETYVDVDLWGLPLDLLKKADIYSLGVVLWEIATRKNVNIPIDTMEHKDFFTLEGYSELPKGYEKLVETCLRHNPSDRPALAEIVTSLHKQVRREK